MIMMVETNAENSSAAKPNKIARGLLIAAAVFGGVFVYNFLTDEFAHSCEDLVPQVVRISKDNGTSRGNALVIDVVEVKEHSKNNGALECSGLGILSSGMKQTIQFRQYSEYDKWWVKYEPTGLPQSR